MMADGRFKIILSNGWKYEGILIKENNTEFIIIDDTSNKETAIQKRHILTIEKE